ncbi:hypothetical protein SKAU_G00057490 [Synaphobranchus kaupii]|uniref:Uncharacterized protein n=1 Tax=Synaphobranchus kaupii TaxID=118154 RepID=A0A9Q1G472_SYNKA|nr:hypothetical protein SKAU_G00057490 [Synaphobranchus kaupii]
MTQIKTLLFGDVRERVVVVADLGPASQLKVIGRAIISQAHRGTAFILLNFGGWGIVVVVPRCPRKLTPDNLQPHLNGQGTQRIVFLALFATRHRLSIPVLRRSELSQSDVFFNFYRESWPKRVIRTPAPTLAQLKWNQLQ